MRQWPDLDEKVWLDYVGNGRLDSERLKPVILRSWQRSAEAKVNPFKVNTDHVLTGSRFSEELDKYEHLIQVAEPVMQELCAQLQGSLTIIVLVSAQGWTLKTAGDLDSLDKAARLNIMVGSAQDERIKGTNAIGTALAERTGVQVLGAEHFVQPIQICSCFSSPILDPKGKLVAVLNATVFVPGPCQHAMAMVTASARAIENQILLQAVQEELMIAYSKVNSLSKAFPQGLMAISSQGIITQINSVGAKILGMNPEACIGRKAEETLDFSIPLSKVHPRDANTSIAIVKGNLHLNSWVSPVCSTKGETREFVVAFHGAGGEGVAAKSKSSPPHRGRYSFANIAGSSPQIQGAIRMAKHAAPRASTVLLCGETGTGKELFAHAIHAASPRENGPFVAVNCGAIPPTLLESELFGYQDGAFTGARRGGYPGKFEQADGGTIFLDEIGDMPLNAQVSLLRVLQESQVTRLGGTRSVDIDVRVIAATQEDLTSRIARGLFRRDLFYRLNVVTINIPPLRHRGMDVILLAEVYLERLRKQYGLVNLRLSPAAVERLLAHSWPGNIRELLNVMERAVMVADGADDVLPEHLPESIFKKADRPPERKLAADSSLRELEQRIIVETLERHGGNFTMAAKALGTARSTLYRKLKSWDAVQCT